MKPLCIDLYAGLGGWAEGFLSEGYDVIGFDVERHDYGTGGYPGQLVLQDVLTLDGRQFRNAAVIVASPPCQAYSRRAMPFGGLWLEHNRMDDDGGPPGNYLGKDPIFNDLFRACFRIALEAGRPIIVENVKGAQKFVGPARWHFGSYYLWGDVPALMPITFAQRKGTGGTWFTPENSPDTRGQVGNPVSVPAHLKTVGVAHQRDGHGHTRHLTNQREHNAARGVKSGELGWKPGHKGKGFNVTNAQRFRQEHGTKQEGSGAAWFDIALNLRRKGDSRKAASAQIAKIPFPLAQHIARVFKP